MGAKLNVYNLGEKGVNVTKTPLHHEDGELLSGQNAEFYAEAGLGGLHKRPGLQRFNTDVMASAVKGVVGVPLPSPSERAVHIFRGSSNGPQVSTDTTTWAEAEGFNSADAHSTGIAGAQKAAHLLGQFYYAGLALNVTPVVFGYDGEMTFELARFGVGNEVRVLGTHNDQVIVSEYTSGSNLSYLWLIDPVTGETRQVGDTATLLALGSAKITAACSFLGKVFIGVMEQVGSGVAHIFYAREGDTTWTLDRDVPTMNFPTTMLAYQGAMYVGYSVVPVAFAILEKRTSAGVWSTERTGTVNAYTNNWNWLTVHLAKLYVGYQALNLPADPKTCEVQENDAGVWTVSKDFDATAPGSAETRGLLSVGQHLWVSILDDTVTFTVAGPWVKTGAGAWVQSEYIGISDVDGGMLAVV